MNSHANEHNGVGSLWCKDHNTELHQYRQHSNTGEVTKVYAHKIEGTNFWCVNLPPGESVKENIYNH